MTDKKDVQFVIQRIYIKDLSYETPNSPQVFQQKWQPKLQLDIETNHKQLSEDTIEVELKLTATVNNEEAVAFLIELNQAGIFTIQGAKNEQKEHLLEIYCPNILFPYAREAIAAQVSKGSFPPLHLAPVNFEALYTQKKEDAAKKTTTSH